MGFSSPKKPLDLADFLSRKGIPRRSRYAYSSRAVGESEPADEDDADAIGAVRSGGTGKTEG